MYANVSYAGAPPDLVQIVTGYAEAGVALTQGPIDKLIFVGSTGVGRQVMRAAAERLTPVTLELGGKDAFIVCDDADLDQVCTRCDLASSVACTTKGVARRAEVRSHVASPACR